MSQPNYNHPSNQNQYSGATRNLIDAASKEIHSKTPNTISFASGSGVASSRRVTNPYDKTTCVRFTPNSEFATPAAALKQVSSFLSLLASLPPRSFTCSITNPPLSPPHSALLHRLKRERELDIKLKHLRKLRAFIRYVISFKISQTMKIYKNTKFMTANTIFIYLYIFSIPHLISTST